MTDVPTSKLFSKITQHWTKTPAGLGQINKANMYILQWVITLAVVTRVIKRETTREFTTTEANFQHSLGMCFED